MRPRDDRDDIRVDPSAAVVVWMLCAIGLAIVCAAVVVEVFL